MSRKLLELGAVLQLIAIFVLAALVEFRETVEEPRHIWKTGILSRNYVNRSLAKER